MSAQTHGRSIGGLCCQVLPQSTTTTRPSKHVESCYGLTVLPPACRPLLPRLSFSVLPPGVVVTVNEEARLPLPNTGEGSLLHASLTLFSLANFSFLLAARLPPPPEKKPHAHAHARAQTRIPTRRSPSPFPRLTVLMVILTRRLSCSSSRGGSD